MTISDLLFVVSGALLWIGGGLIYDNIQFRLKRRKFRRSTSSKRVLGNIKVTETPSGIKAEGTLDPEAANYIRSQYDAKAITDWSLGYIVSSEPDAHWTLKPRDPSGETRMCGGYTSDIHHRLDEFCVIGRRPHTAHAVGKITYLDQQ